MKMTIRINTLLKTRLLGMATLLTMAVAFASCAGEEIAQGEDGKTTGTETEADKNLTTFVAGNPETRTSFEFNTGAFYWEEGDRIYVKDDDGTWQVSRNAVTAARAGSASFKFMVPGKFTVGNTYKVYYPGKNGMQDQVTIPANQDQPTVNGTTGSDYPKLNTDPRYYSTRFGANYEGTRGLFNPSSARHVPNVNEMAWYAIKGDPRWDSDELWTTMGQVYKGGIWLKKAARIAADNGTSLTAMQSASPGGDDLRHIQFLSKNSTVSSTAFTVTEQADYFYLPALGDYSNGTLRDVGVYGRYWSSTYQTWFNGTAYICEFYSSRIHVSGSMCSFGSTSVPFK